MTTHIINFGSVGNSIIWDSFRNSYTLLMPTVPHVIECKISDFGILYKKKSLCFFMFNTNGFQESTRIVIGESVFNKEYGTSYDLSEDELIKYFEQFFNDYINSLEQ